MSITYPLSLPNNKIRRIQFFATSAIGVVASQFTFSRQTQEHAGKMLGAEIVLAPQTREDAAGWNAFILKLSGQLGTFLLYDPLALTPQGVATGTPLVKGASQVVGSQSLVTDGWTAGQTNILKADDCIQIGTGSASQLYKVLNDVDSDGSGNATLDIFPGLLTSPADNAPITVTNCVGVFALSQNQSQIYASDETRVYDQVITCVQVVG